jgi:hypothetical protein
MVSLFKGYRFLHYLYGLIRIRNKGKAKEIKAMQVIVVSDYHDKSKKVFLEKKGLKSFFFRNKKQQSFLFKRFKNS